jgi:hypothetical protein
MELPTEQNPIYSGYGYNFPGTLPSIGDKKKIDYELPKRGRDNESEQQTQTSNEEEIEEEKDVSMLGDLITVNLANKLVLEFLKKFPKQVESIFNKFLQSNKPALKEEAGDAVIDMKSADAINMTKELASLIPYKTTFSKEVLTMLLAQPRCTGIKFYFCMGLSTEDNNNIKPSLVLVGVDKNGKDLNSTEPNKSIIYLKQTNGEVYPDSITGLTAPRQKTLVYEVGGVDGKAIKTLDKEYEEMAKSGLDFLSQNSSNTTTGDE